MKERIPIPPGLQGWAVLCRTPDTMPQAHRHDELELNLVVRGRARYLLRNRYYEISPHTLVWLFPGQDHLLMRESDDFEMWVVVFSCELVQRIRESEDYATLAKSEPVGHFCKRLANQPTERLTELLLHISQAENDPVLHNAALAYLLPLAWRLSLEAQQSPAGQDVHPAVEKAVGRISAGVGDENLDQLAVEVGASPSHLSRLFIRQLGVSLVDFRNSKRVERFVRIYGSGQRYNLLEAALQAGFGSYAQFYRVFKNTMGLSPGEYRGRKRGG